MDIVDALAELLRTRAPWQDGGQAPSAPAGTLANAAALLESVEGMFSRLPRTREARELRERWSAFRTVLHGVVVGRAPTLTDAQFTTFLANVLSLAARVAELSRDTE